MDEAIRSWRGGYDPSSVLQGAPRGVIQTVSRKLIESTLLSLDGVIGDPQVWANQYFDDEATALALQQLLVSDAMGSAR